MDLLARREYGRFELTRKLCQCGALVGLVDPVLDRLADEGLLSDARYLEAFVRKRAIGGYGPLRIREELARQGLSRSAIEQAFQESTFDWSERLRDVWQRKFAGQKPQDQRERGKQARFLAYRGFPADMISQLWRDSTAD